MLDTLFANPVTSVPFLARALEVSEHALGPAIQTLAEAGVLEQSGRDRHQKTRRSPEALALLDELAYQAPRRGGVA